MEALGINIVNVFIYIILFLILYLILDKFLVSALTGMIDKRDKEVKEGSAMKKEAEEKLAKADSEIKEKLDKLEDEKVREIDEIKSSNQAELAKIIEEAQQKADAIIKEASAKAKTIDSVGKEQLDKEVEKKAREILKKYIQSDKDLNQKLLTQLIKKS